MRCVYVIHMVWCCCMCYGYPIKLFDGADVVVFGCVSVRLSFVCFYIIFFSSLVNECF